MNQKLSYQIAAIIMISVLLTLYLSPVIAYAGKFMTPGQPMTPGKFYTPGVPATGGTFMVPGKVYEPGKGYDPGKVKGNGKFPAISGQPFLPGTPYDNGGFLIPNAPTPQVPGLFWRLQPLDAGSPIQDGNFINGGNVNVGGKGQTGRNVNPDSTSRDGSTLANNGLGPNGEVLILGPGTSDSGKESGDDNSSIPKSKFGKETVGELDTIFLQHQDTGRGLFGHIAGGINDGKNFLLSFLNKEVAGPILAAMAGFDVQHMPNGKSGYKVTPGKSKYNNRLLNNIYQEYKSYYDGKAKSLGAHTNRIKEKTFNTFLESKNLRLKGMNPLTYVGKSTLTAIKDAWNPLSKGFWSGSNVAKLSGPLNYALTSANSLFDFSSKGKYRDYGYKSTEFAADLSVELAIGVGTTALSSVASSVAIGAAAGSAVPVVGTIAGAAFGLVVGLGTNYFINGTRRGIRIKNTVKKAVNKALKGGVNLFKNGVKKLGGVFGF